MSRATSGTALAALLAISEALREPVPGEREVSALQVVQTAMRDQIAQTQPDDGNGPSDTALQNLAHLLFEIEQHARRMRGQINAIFIEPTPVSLRYWDYQGTDIDDRECASQWEAGQVIEEWLDPALFDDWRYEGQGRVYGGKIVWVAATDQA